LTIEVTLIFVRITGQERLSCLYNGFFRGVLAEVKSYPFKVSSDGLEYSFDSVGSNGVIAKIARFRSTEDEHCFQLSFGDAIDEADKINDFAISNNGDREMILHTVKEIVFDFIDAKFRKTVFFTGATSTRNRLYRMFISRYFDELRNSVEIYGVHAAKWEIFKRNKPYDAFLISRNGNFNFKLK
jgi:hypothetical protein